MSKVDPYGRVLFSKEDLKDLLYQGVDITQIFCEDPELVKQVNHQLIIRDLENDFGIQNAPLIEHSVEEEHAKRCAEWLIPEEYKVFDIEEFVLALCNGPEETNRAQLELKMFSDRNMFNVLRAMIYLVTECDKNDIVIGVGRGSSVASFIFFKIGLTKVNPLLYGLNIEEFLR